MWTGESSEFDALHHPMCINFWNALYARKFKPFRLIYRNKTGGWLIAKAGGMRMLD